MTRPYKRGKKGAGRHVQLPEYLQATDAWATLKPGPRALYIELKRRYNGSNNGRIILSHRDAALALNVHRNTVGAWFKELEERGLITMTQGPTLGPSGCGLSAQWALQELPTAGGKSAGMAFRGWREKQKPRTKTVHDRHNGCATQAVSSADFGASVTDTVTPTGN